MAEEKETDSMEYKLEKVTVVSKSFLLSLVLK